MTPIEIIAVSIACVVFLAVYTVAILAGLNRFVDAVATVTEDGPQC